MTNKQSQKSGDHSQQIQANNVVNIFGIDEKRAREIFKEQWDIAKVEFTNEAAITANQRIMKFDHSFIKRMIQKNTLTAFSDPAFQILLIEAQKRAVSTEREEDYDLLSELMIHRFQKGSDRIIRAGITRAIEIVDQISDEALLALTVFHSVSYFIPVSGDMTQGLKVLDDLFGKVIYGTLPKNISWLEHLDILDAVRVSLFGGTKLLEDYWYEQFDGYLKNGIEENSEKHKEAKEILTEAGLEQNFLVKNFLNEKYVKILVLNKNRITNIVRITTSGECSLTDSEKIALEKIYDLYDDNKISKQDFITEIEKYPNLKKLREWFNTLNRQSIQITSVGRVLAHSNAQRIDRTLPPLD